MKYLHLKKIFFFIVISSLSLFLLIACGDKSNTQTNVEDYSISYSIPEFEFSGTKIVFTRNEKIDVKDKSFPFLFLPKLPTYIPNDFVRIYNFFEKDSILLNYENSEDKFLIYSSDLVIDNYTVRVPYKDIKVEELNISGIAADYIILNDKNVLSWFDETCMYSFTSNLSKEELIEIAKKNIAEKNNI